MRSALLLLLGVLLAAAFDSVLAADDDEIDVDRVDAGGDSVDVEDGANAAAGEDLRVAVKEVLYTAPQLNGEAFFSETFDKGLARWLKSEAKKDGVDEEIAKYAGEWAVEEAAVASVKGDVGLVMKSKAKHHAIAVLLDKPFEFKDAKSFIIQYEVKFQNGMECGGAYVKLLSKNADGEEDLKRFTDKTPYTVMFGPDKCGSDSKLHFIVRHRNPKTGEYSEKHGKKASSLPELYDKNSHLFRLTLGSDNSWEVRVDGSIVNAGSLLDDMEPPINPPAEIDDPSDSKPEDWDDRKKIPDPDATKPDDWDENEPEKIVDESAVKPSDWLEDEAAMIPDPTATKPDDWDNDMDGDWEAPLVSNPKCSSAAGCGPWTAPQIPNPKYKGKWRAPMIDNPSYKGTWKARRIANPEFFEDKAPFSGLAPIAAVGLELWSMTDGVLFDNFLVTDSGAVADSWAETGWYIKRDVELASKAATEAQSSVVGWIKKSYEEKPWLVIACAAVPVIVILLIVYTCCCTASKKDEAAVTKKTDAVTPDDVHDAGQEKDGADSEKEDEPPKAAGDAKPSAAAKPAASESSDDDAKNKGGESSTGEDSQSPLRRSARRKPRKDT